MKVKIRKHPAGRDTLAQLLKGRVLELGVEKGKYSELICKVNPDVELYMVDHWTHSDSYRAHVSQEELDSFRAEAEDRVKGYNAKTIKGYSVEVSKIFQDEYLDAIYIDAGHETHEVYEDLCLWYPKVRSGGIISGHDIRGRHGEKVKKAVLDFCKEQGIGELTIWNGDNAASYHFIKP